jgi:hypothetical protein
MDRISRGWALTKQSWRVLKSDRSLAVFPILSTIFALIAVAAIWLPTASMSGVFAGEAVNENNPGYYVAAVVTAYVSTFIAVFFNVALAACAVHSMQGEDTTVGEGIRFALQRIGPILGWTFVAATVGLILRIVEERVPVAARIAVWIAGAAWGGRDVLRHPGARTRGQRPVAVAQAFGGRHQGEMGRGGDGHCRDFGGGGGGWPDDGRHRWRMRVGAPRGRVAASRNRGRGRRGHGRHRRLDHFQRAHGDLSSGGVPVRGHRHDRRCVRQRPLTERVRRAQPPALT